MNGHIRDTQLFDERRHDFAMDAPRHGKLRSEGNSLDDMIELASVLGSVLSQRRRKSRSAVIQIAQS